MAFLENLAEGFAQAAGSTGTVNRIEKQKSDRQANSQEELHGRTQMILNDVQGVQQKIAAIDPNDPSAPQKRAQYQKELGSLQQVFTDLYHPVKNPGALQQLGGILNRIRGKQTPQAPSGPSMTERMAQANVYGAGAGQPAQPDKMAEVKKAYKAAFGADIPDEQAQKFFNHLYGGAPLEPKPEAENWVPAAVKFSDGTEATLQRNSKTGEWTDLAGNPVPKEKLSTATVTPKTTGQPKVAWKRLPNGRYVSMQLDANNHFKPGTENYDQAPPASITGRISTGQFHFVDEKGQVHEVQETRTSMPAGSAPSAAGKQGTKTAGEQKRDLNDKVIGFKGNKDYNETKQGYEGAVDRTDTMEKNLTNALQGDQQAMLSLVANHIGMTLGTQKGARITRAVWDEAVESAPWLARAASRFDARGYLTGVTLTPEQMKQMVRLAHEKTQTLKEHLDRLNQERGGSPSDKKDDPLGIL